MLLIRLWKPFRLLNQHKVAVVVMIVGFLMTAAAGQTVARIQVQERRETYREQSSLFRNSLQQKLGEFEKVTRSLGAFWNASETRTVTQGEFVSFTESLLPYHSGLLGFGWTEKRSLTDDKLTDDNLPTIRAYPDGDRPTTEYVLPLTYVYSEADFQPYLGLDANTDVQRRLALARAERLGLLSSTKSVTLENGQSGFVLYYPIFSNQAIAPEQKLRGFVSSFYETAAWLDKSIGELNTNGLDFYIYDMAEDQLESALRKDNVHSNSNLLAYRQNTQITVVETNAQNHVDVDAALGDRPCPLGNKSITACIYSAHVANRELSVIIIPTQTPVWLSWRMVSVVGFGLISTAALAAYLVLSKQAALNIEEKNTELEALLKQLHRTQTQLIHTEKMSGLGRLVGGIAHEINNPLNYVMNNANYAKRYFQDLLRLIQYCDQTVCAGDVTFHDLAEEIELDFIVDDLPRLLDSMGTGTQRLRDIVASLRSFSRLDEAQLKWIDVHASLDNTLVFLHSKFKGNSRRNEIQIERHYGDLPEVECYASDLNQVFMHLIDNAIDVLDAFVPRTHHPAEQPTITISTAAKRKNQVSIFISDNGAGIPENIQEKIFDPFFSTKAIGQGTGLGLSISYQVIVEKHGGQLSCRSVPGQGTMLIIDLPVRLPQPEKVAMAIA